jgi:hypothetical protein
VSAARTCAECRGRGGRLGLHFDTVVTDRGGLRHGVLLCLRCYLERHPHAPVGDMPRSEVVRREPKPLESFRRTLVEALRRDGMCLYVGPNRVAGWCPVCDEPLVVQFKASHAAADLLCRSGCAEREIAALLGKARRR